MFKTIKKGDEISELFSSGKRISFRYFYVFYSTTEDARIAFIAGKKLGNSVTRNHLRRKLKRAYVENKTWFEDKKAIIVAKHSLLSAKDEEVKKNFRRVVRKIDKKNRK